MSWVRGFGGIALVIIGGYHIVSGFLDALEAHAMNHFKNNYEQARKRKRATQ